MHKMTAESYTSIRELDSRLTSGVQVRLLWCEVDRRLWVAVVDTRTGEAFRVEVGENERPLDVCYHPHGYAAHDCVDALISAGSADILDRYGEVVSRTASRLEGAGGERGGL